MCRLVIAVMLAACLGAAVGAGPEPQTHAISSAQEQEEQQEPQEQGLHHAYLQQHAHTDSELWRWLTDNGAALNFLPAVSEYGVRGGVAVADIPAGGLVASIPMRLAMYFPAKYGTVAELAAQLSLEARKPDSRYRPYLESLASLTHSPILSWESFPPSYLHLLQDAAPLADVIVARQAALERYWSREGMNLTRAGVSLEDLRAALVLITTRSFDGGADGPNAGQSSLIPGIDFLNHHNDCPVRYQLTHCPTLEAESPEGVHPAAAAAADAQEVCFVAHTEAAVAAGAELCVWYGHLAPDVALMQYGFLLPDGLEMSKVDQKGVTANEINGEGRHSPPPPQLSAAWAPTEKLTAERDRLAARAAALDAARPFAEITPPASSDRDGQILGMVLHWLHQRRAAIASEVARLDAEIAALGAAKPAVPSAAATAGGAASGAARAEL